MSERWVYFGGTFDPVHVGHIRIARALAEGVGASRVLLAPTGVNPLKPPPIASGEDRLAMLTLATRYDDLFEICPLELNRQPPCYTIDTIEQLRGQLPPDAEIHLAIGADMLADLPKWRRISELLGMVHLAVACRPPMTQRDVEEAIQKLAPVLTGGREIIRAQAVATPLLDISSTEIRRKLSKGESVDSFLQKEVLEYIIQNKLYNAVP